MRHITNNSLHRLIQRAREEFTYAHKFAAVSNDEAVAESKRIYNDGRYWRLIQRKARKQAEHQDAVGLTAEKPYIIQKNGSIIGACNAYSSGVGVIR